MKRTKSLLWVTLWIALAAAFATIIYFWMGKNSALEFTTGYLVELSLSVDNLFIFLLIFRYFQVPAQYQRKVLFWGLVGALVMRAVFIVAGVALLRKFEWIAYLFGVLLVYSGIRLMRGHESVNLENNAALRLLRRVLPVTDSYRENKFVVRDPRWSATPLFVALIAVEVTDLIFATDSIPAILAITLNTFIVYTSNAFAILGLRSMYFALSDLLDAFEYLHYGLATILIFIGGKMLLGHFYGIPVVITLAAVGGILAVSMIASVAFRPAE